jgi:hypothetical protein
MAYAKLTFTAGTHVLKKLKEIVRFATGAITTTADLQHADPGTSEILISDAPGWTLESQTLEASGTATASLYRLTAPCVNSLKSKCIEIRSRTSRDLTITDTNGVTSYFYATSGSTDTTGFIALSMGDSWTGVTLNNATAYITGGKATTRTGTVSVPGASLSNTIIYVFCSARKLIIFCPESDGKSHCSSILEFPETTFSLKHDNLPAILSEFKFADSDRTPKMSPTTNFFNDMTVATLDYPYKHFFTNWYNNELNTRENRSIWDYGISTLEFFTTPVLTRNSAGTSAYPLLPLVDVRVVYGEGIHNYSSLTGMYMTYRAAAYAGQGDTLTVGAEEYVVLQVGNATANYRAFAIKKG